MQLCNVCDSEGDIESMRYKGDAKYIVKNCPCYELDNCNCEHLEHKYCDDCDDCPIKQVAKISSEYYDVYCNHCVTKKL